ncbi:hypothetical protein AUJ62_00670 [Candidatus Pacearchaeota archaeon CG1_02_32_21]|nr:MAG: hypothetical protein AUJ62_00670 [Candidatus Pacearchaeota archaeon CG1_02_32_21]
MGNTKIIRKYHIISVSEGNYLKTKNLNVCNPWSNNPESAEIFDKFDSLTLVRILNRYEGFED